MSAAEGVTDLLERIAAGEAQAEAFTRAHSELARAAGLAPERLESAQSLLDAALESGVLEDVLVQGELLAAQLLGAVLSAGALFDPRELGLRLDSAVVGGVAVGGERARAALEAAGALVVVPGFVALGADGAPATLGRGGSDATAVWLAATLGASAVELHKPVAGVRRADPEWVPQAARVPALTWDEAHELARRGARVLQARAASLARAHGVGIELRALAAPEAPGTRVGAIEPRPTPRVVALVHDVLPGGQRCELFLVGERAGERADLAERAGAALAGAGLSARPLVSRSPHAVGFELPLREAHEGMAALHAELFDDRPR